MCLAVKSAQGPRSLLAKAAPPARLALMARWQPRRALSAVSDSPFVDCCWSALQLRCAVHACRDYCQGNTSLLILCTAPSDCYPSPLYPATLQWTPVVLARAATSANSALLAAGPTAPTSPRAKTQIAPCAIVNGPPSMSGRHRRKIAMVRREHVLVLETRLLL